MEPYLHRVQYYETDKMGITHHSNYIRWMEEARVDFLARIGWDFAMLEGLGIVSPVMSVSCKFRSPTTFDDDVYVSIAIKELRAVRMTIGYEMRDRDGKLLCDAVSEHAFLDTSGHVIRLNRDYPAFYAALSEYVELEEKQ